MKNHVLENIILGIQGGIAERGAPKNLYDKELGFGHPATPVPHIEDKKSAEKGKPESKMSYAARHTKSFFSFKT